MSRQHQDGCDAARARRQHVRFGIAYEPASREVEVEIRLRPKQQAGPGLAAFARDFEFRHLVLETAIRVVRAIVRGLEVCAFQAKQGVELRVDVLEALRRAVAPRDDRLVGHQDDPVLGAVEPPHSLARERKHVQIVRCRDVTVHLVERPVPIQEDGGLGVAQGRALAPCPRQAPPRLGPGVPAYQCP